MSDKLEERLREVWSSHSLIDGLTGGWSEAGAMKMLRAAAVAALEEADRVAADAGDSSDTAFERGAKIRVAIRALAAALPEGGE